MNASRAAWPSLPKATLRPASTQATAPKNGTCLNKRHFHTADMDLPSTLVRTCSPPGFRDHVYWRNILFFDIHSARPAGRRGKSLVVFQSREDDVMDSKTLDRQVSDKHC